MLIRNHLKTQAGALPQPIGFSHPVLHEQARGRDQRAFAEFLTVTALFVSLAVAVTAVSIGIARADARPTSTTISFVQ
jgi:hypothetical protein